VDALNPAYSSLDGVLFNKSQTSLIAYLGGKAGSYAIPDSVTNVGDFAFFDCAGLTSLTIANSVSTMSRRSNYCTSLDSMTVAPLNPSYSGVDWVLLDKNQTTLITYPPGKGGIYTIPDSVRNIADYTFYECTDLASVTIGNNVENIGYG